MLLAFTTKTTLEKGFSLFKKESDAFELESKGAIAMALDSEKEYSQQHSLLNNGSDEDLSDPDDDYSGRNKGKGGSNSRSRR